jgi:1-aminocyclopropane-1-carboxylate deaminase/D-cysteine desulfhydrase-like pyridoxal-dependent ACC family enzyme
MDTTTPTQYYPDYRLWAKREDLFGRAGIRGGKVRSCEGLIKAYMAGGGRAGVVTAGARHSPQMQIVARLAAHYGLPCRCHTATGPYTPEMHDAAAHGAVVVQHRPGHNSVIIARARADANGRGWLEIPFGMESPAALQYTRNEARNLVPGDYKRIVIVLGSGMTAAGLLWGLRDAGWQALPVLGVQIGASPIKRLNKYAPPWWHAQMNVVVSPHPYKHPIPNTWLCDAVLLDPYYEAKCATFLRPGDLFWIVGIRAGLDAGIPAEM